jgi:hypothetical protein
MDSPTAMGLPPPRTSPPSRSGSRVGRVSPSNPRLGRVSPPSTATTGSASGAGRVGRTSPPGLRVSPKPTTIVGAGVPLKHRRSPTAPEQGSAREEGREGEYEYGGVGSEREKEREREGRRQLQQQYIQAPPASAPAAVSASVPPHAPAPPAPFNRHMVVGYSFPRYPPIQCSQLSRAR